jgi:hypothetical protein
VESIAETNIIDLSIVICFATGQHEFDFFPAKKKKKKTNQNY